MIGRPSHRLLILFCCSVVAYITADLSPSHRTPPGLVALNLLFLGLPAWCIFEVGMAIQNHLRNHGTASKVRLEPSKWGEFFILLFAPKEYAEGLMGDLEEIFNRELATGMSRRRVLFRYWGRLFRAADAQVNPYPAAVK
jgi:hypothetical protein